MQNMKRKEKNTSVQPDGADWMGAQMHGCRN
jgi:hypothetical protein